MAQRASGTTSTISGLLAAIVTVCSADGWTIHLNTASRVHISKNGYHYELYAGSSDTIYLVGCTGYDAGAIPTAQPGASSVATCPSMVYSPLITTYVVISTGTSLFCFLDRRAYIGGTFSLGVIQDKIGSWTGGQFVQGIGAFNSESLPWSLSGFYPSPTPIYINGSWTPNTSWGHGTGVYDVCTLRSEMPCSYNAGVLLLPTPVFVKNVTDSSLLHPIGYVPDLYMVRGGDVYLVGDVVTFDGTDYTAEVVRPGVSTMATLMVKMNA